MSATAKSIRKIIGHICGAWVRVWSDGEIWCGIDRAARGSRQKNLNALVTALEGAGYGCTFDGAPNTSGSNVITVTEPEAS